MLDLADLSDLAILYTYGKTRMACLQTCRYQNMVNFNRQQFFSEEVNKAKGDVKKLYQLTELTGGLKENPFPEVASDAELANRFATFFLNKIIFTRAQLDNSPKHTCEPITQYQKKFAPMTERQVRSLFGNMKTKSSELDLIPTKILKEHLDVFFPVLTKIINIGIENSTFYEGWKYVIVRLLLERPISIFVIKITDQFLIYPSSQKQLKRAFWTHLLITVIVIISSQTFSRHIDKATPVKQVLLNDVLWAMERQRVTTCAFLDLSAAFDTVDHDLLLFILGYQYAISGSALQWYESYLCTRYFKVCVNKTFSDK